MEQYSQEKILDIFHRILPGVQVRSVHRYSEGEAVKNVWRICAEKDYILKHAGLYECRVYSRYFQDRVFPVSVCAGSLEADGVEWILLEYIEGRDLSLYSGRAAVLAAESITAVHRCFFTEDRRDDRFVNYLKRIRKRAESLKNEPLLAEAYELFLKRQETIPLTLCNGDLLPCNLILNGEHVRIIDWGFGGIMPYALDAARMISHGVDVPNEQTFPFIMNETEKVLFLKTYYRLSGLSLSYESFMKDIHLAMLNEYIEFIEEELLTGAETVNENLYYSFARCAAEQILRDRINE